jgi:hypothetical protein
MGQPKLPQDLLVLNLIVESAEVDFEGDQVVSDGFPLFAELLFLLLQNLMLELWELPWELPHD